MEEQEIDFLIDEAGVRSEDENKTRRMNGIAAKEDAEASERALKEITIENVNLVARDLYHADNTIAIALYNELAYWVDNS